MKPFRHILSRLAVRTWFALLLCPMLVRPLDWDLRKIGSVAFQDKYSHRVVVSKDGKHILTAGGQVVIDVGDPTNPHVLKSTDTNIVHGSAAVASGNYLYAVAGRSLEVVDISDPGRPRRAGSHRESGEEQEGGGVAVAGNHVYWADPLVGLHVLDVSNPAKPARVATLSIVERTWDVVTAGPFAYVTKGGYWDETNVMGGLLIIDISDPAKPKRVGALAAIGFAADVAVDGGFAHVAVEGGLVVVDIGNPARPRRAGGLDTGGSSRAVKIAGHYAWVASSGGGLLAIDITDPSHPQRAGSYDSQGYVYDVVVAGGRAFLVEEPRWDGTLMAGGGLVILNIADPARPAFLSRYGAGESFGSVTVADGHAYLAGMDGMEVVDITDLANPRRVGGNFIRQAEVGQVLANSGRVFFAGNGELIIFDGFRPFRLEPSTRPGVDGPRLKLTGPRGLGVRLQRSLDLARWEDWKPATLSGGTMDFEDREIVPGPNRFYRAVAE